MVPISRGKQVIGILGAIALGYAFSWISTPGPGTGPVETFRPTFGSSVAPVVVAPAEEDRHHTEDASNSVPRALKTDRNEPI